LVLSERNKIIELGKDNYKLSLADNRQLTLTKPRSPGNTLKNSFHLTGTSKSTSTVSDIINGK
jgi:hypothetical protein